MEFRTLAGALSAFSFFAACGLPPDRVNAPSGTDAGRPDVSDDAFGGSSARPDGVLVPYGALRPYALADAGPGHADATTILDAIASDAGSDDAGFDSSDAFEFSDVIEFSDVTEVFDSGPPDAVSEDARVSDAQAPRQDAGGLIDAGRALDADLVDSGTPLMIVTSTLPPAYRHRHYSALLEATGGQPPYTWSGRTYPLMLVDNRLEGVPVSPFSYRLSLEVEDVLGQTAQADLHLTVLPVPTIGHDANPIDVDMCEETTISIAASRGRPPYAWSATGPALLAPQVVATSTVGAQLRLSPPGESGVWEVVVSVVDANLAVSSSTITVESRTPLSVSLGRDRVVAPGTSVNLFATSDPGASFAWEAVTAPAGSNILAPASLGVGPEISVLADVGGLYTIRSAATRGVCVADDEMHIMASPCNVMPRPLPIAPTEAGRPVVLDGTQSSGTSFEWSIFDTPFASGFMPSDVLATTASTTFVPDVVGRYALGLTARSPTCALDDITYLDAVCGSVADAGPDRIVRTTDDAIELAGSGSRTVGAATFRWEVLERPDGARGGVLSATSSRAWVNPRLPGRWTYELTAADAHCAHTDRVNVEVVCGVSAVAQAPSVAALDVPVQLISSSSRRRNPSTRDQWTLLSLPAADMANRVGPIGSRLTPRADGTYVFQLRLEEDGCVDTSTIALMATSDVFSDAGEDQVLTVGSTVRLEAPTIPGVSYVWRSLGAFPGQPHPQFPEVNAQIEQFNLQLVADYVFELEVSRGTAVATDQVTISVVEHAPGQRIIVDQPEFTAIWNEQVFAPGVVDVRLAERPLADVTLAISKPAGASRVAVQSDPFETTHTFTTENFDVPRQFYTYLSCTPEDTVPCPMPLITISTPGLAAVQRPARAHIPQQIVVTRSGALVEGSTLSYSLSLPNAPLGATTIHFDQAPGGQVHFDLNNWSAPRTFTYTIPRDLDDHDELLTEYAIDSCGRPPCEYYARFARVSHVRDPDRTRICRGISVTLSNAPGFTRVADPVNAIRPLDTQLWLLEVTPLGTPPPGMGSPLYDWQHEAGLRVLYRSRATFYAQYSGIDGNGCYFTNNLTGSFPRP